MRVYNGHVHEGDYIARYGYSQAEYDHLRAKHPEILITWFPVEGHYDACLPGEGYRSVGEPHRDKMACLKAAIKLTTDS